MYWAPTMCPALCWALGERGDKPANVGPTLLELTDLGQRGVWWEECLEKVTFKLRARVERRSTQCQERREGTFQAEQTRTKERLDKVKCGRGGKRAPYPPMGASTETNIFRKTTSSLSTKVPRGGHPWPGKATPGYLLQGSSCTFIPKNNCRRKQNTIRETDGGRNS